jgi:hypothetical protein
MNRCYPSAAAGVCCGRPSLRSRLRPPERWIVTSGSRGPSSFSSFSYLGEAGDELPEGLPWLLPHCMEVGLHTVLLVSTGEVRHEPRIEFFPGVD